MWNFTIRQLILFFVAVAIAGALVGMGVAWIR
jgi:hypothetical protein